MGKMNGWKGVAVACTLATATAIGAQAQTLTTLVAFDGSNGSEPAASLVQGADGNLYGTTRTGGGSGEGTVFKANPDGKLTTLYSFCSQANCADGSAPTEALVLGSDGNFYGVTYNGGTDSTDCYGGCGTVFRISADGTLTTLHSFNLSDGAFPEASLVQGTDGKFYGTTYGGGTHDNCYGFVSSCGTVYTITADGEFKTIHNFISVNGGAPDGALVEGRDGMFYGTTLMGGPENFGTVFRVSPDGVLTTLHDFVRTDGDLPLGALVQGADGSFYGVSGGGGRGCSNAGCGTVFEMTPHGALGRLYTFGSDPGGYYPVPGLVWATDGNLYGTTSADWSHVAGTIFELSEAGTQFIYTFCSEPNCADGRAPLAGPVQHTNGSFYGTTSQGGDTGCNSTGCGTVFGFSTGLGPFVALVHPAGRVGREVGILGQGFAGATSVSFNGIPATFTVRRDTFLVATVPAGATTGFVTVTTPTGTLTSNVKFNVLP